MSKIFSGKSPYLSCICCGRPMLGIYRYSVRDICTPCGGFAKLDENYNEENEKRLVA